jgi:hypothetical protein
MIFLRKNKSAQQIIETLLLFTAVIVVLVIFLRPAGPFRKGINKAIDTVIDAILH